MRRSLGIVGASFVGASLFGSPTPSYACDPAALQYAIHRAEDAFAVLDAPGFYASAQEAEAAVACAEQPLSSDDIAAYHRVRALSAFMGKDERATISFFAASRALAPDYSLSAALAPEGHPLYAAFVAAAAVRPDLSTLAPPQMGWLLVDGRRTRRAPTARPYVLQHVLDNGSIVDTQTVAPGERPEYPEGRQQLTRRDKIALGVGVGLLSVGAGLYGGAFVTRSNYTRAQITGNRQRAANAAAETNALGIAGAVLMGSGGIVSIVAVF